MGPVAAVDDDVGLGVDGIALGDQLAEHLALVVILQERPVVAAGGAPDQEFELGPQPHRHPFLADSLARDGVHEGTAAGGQYVHRTVEQARDHAPLAVAKRGLAMDLEDILDRAARGLLDLGVGVDEGNLEARREPPAHGRLSGPHQADDHHRPVGTPGFGLGHEGAHHGRRPGPTSDVEPRAKHR